MTEQTPRRPRRRPTAVSLLLFGVIALGVWWFGGQEPAENRPPEGLAATAESTVAHTPTSVAPAETTTTAAIAETLEPTAESPGTTPTEIATQMATPSPLPTETAEPTAESPTTTPTPTPTPDSRAPPGMPIVTFDDLPPEAVETIELIEIGGPFPYSKDGSVFQNREGFLPDEARGYYREYTVTTPGASNRGARRIVAGDDGEIYYTSDHYASFSWVVWE